MSKSLIQSGRPRLLVNYGLILDLRDNENLGWSRVATEYTKRTGQYISKQTCKRRYEETRAETSSMMVLGILARKSPHHALHNFNPDPM